MDAVWREISAGLVHGQYPYYARCVRNFKDILLRYALSARTKT